MCGQLSGVPHWVQTAPSPRSAALGSLETLVPIFVKVLFLPWPGKAAGRSGCLPRHLLGFLSPLAVAQSLLLQNHTIKSREVSRKTHLPGLWHLPPSPAPTRAYRSVSVALAKLERLQEVPSSRGPAPRQHSPLRTGCCTCWPGQWGHLGRQRGQPLWSAHDPFRTDHSPCPREPSIIPVAATGPGLMGRGPVDSGPCRVHPRL